MVEGSRVAEVIAELPDGAVRRGSGYRTATAAVLTAAHVVEHALRVRVRFDADTDAEWESVATRAWSDTPADLAVLAITPRDEVAPARFGRIGDGAAVLPATAVGFPLWKLKDYEPDGPVVARYRDTHHASGMVAVLSNRREGTLELTVTPPERDPDPAVSPWQGMSGAALWIGDRIVGVIARHHRGDGLGRLTAVRIVPELPGLTEPLPDVLRPNVSDLVLTNYRKQVEAIAPARLLDREDELAELTRFVAADEPYGWWQAGPWAGKSALMAWFVLNPPEGVDVVSFFVTGRLAAQEDCEAFTKELTLQLAALTGEHLPDVLTLDGCQNQLWRLLAAAASRPRRLVVVIDGLDEDAGAAHGKPSIASLLPRRPPANVRFLIASRPDPPVPDDVLDEDHPLLTCARRVLTPSPHAKSMARRAVNELNRQLAGDDLRRELLGLITASGGGLTRADLAALTSRAPYEIDRLLDGLLGRTIGTRPAPLRPEENPPVHLFAHETLAHTARAKFGAAVRAYQDRLHEWADSYRERGWPADTPQYLLLGYAHTLADAGDHDRLVALCTDRARHDRMLLASGGDAPAASEVRLAQDVLRRRPVPDLSALLLLAAHHHRLARRNSEIPVRLPLVWMMLGDPARAVALARGITDHESRARSLIALAEFAGRGGERERCHALVTDVRTFARGFSDPVTREVVLKELVTAAARAGEPDLAISLAADLRDPFGLGELFVRLAESAAADGDHALACRFGAQVSDAYTKADVFRKLARWATTPGQFTQAWRLVEGIADFFVRAHAVAGFVRDDLAAGGRARVHEFLDVLAEPAVRDHGLAVAAEEVAATGQCEHALAFARGIAEPALRAQTLVLLATTVRAAGDHDRATTLFAEAWTTIPDIAGHHARAQTAIEAALAIAAGAPPPHALLADVEELVRAVPDAKGRLELLPQLATAVAVVGDRERAQVLLDEAKGLVDRITDQEYRDQTRTWLLTRAIRAGEVDWAVAEVHEFADHVRRATAMIIVADTVAGSGAHDRALSLLTGASALLLADADRNEVTRALARATHVAAACGDHELALELVHGIADAEARDMALSDLAWAAIDEGDQERALSLARQLVNDSSRGGVVTALVRAVAVAGDQERALAMVHRFRKIVEPDEVLAQLVEMAAADRAWDQAVTLVRAMADPERRSGALADLVLAVAAEDPERADGMARDVVDPDRLPEVLTGLAEAAVATGDRDRARALLADVATLTGAFPGPGDRSAVRAVDVAIAAGDRDRALGLAGTIASPSQRAHAFTQLAEAAARAGDHRAARDLVEAAEDLARNFAYAAFLASITGLVAASVVVGEQDRARRLVQAHPDAGTRARVLTDAAVSTGDPEAARTLLADAVAAANEIPDAGERAQSLTTLVGVADTLGQPDLVPAIVASAEDAIVPVTAVEARLELTAYLARAVGTGHPDITSALLTTAAAMTGTLPDSGEPGHVLAALAETAIALGDLDRAEDLARAITGPYARHRALTALALAVDEAGDHDRALSVIGDMDSDFYRNEAVKALMERAAVAGDHDRARSLALAAVGWLHQAQLLTWLARFATAFGAHERALSLVRDTARAGDLAEGLAWLVRAAVAAGDHDRARTLAEQIPPHYPVDAEEYLSGHRPAVPGLYPVDLSAHLIDRHVAAGDRASALSLARDITDHHLRASQLTKLVDAEITAGDRAQALSIAREITDPDCRAAALSQVVTAAAAAGDIAQARSLLAEVLVLGRWYESVRLAARVAPAAVVPVLDELQARCLS